MSRWLTGLLTFAVILCGILMVGVGVTGIVHCLRPAVEAIQVMDQGVLAK